VSAIRVACLSTSDHSGGAARAAVRIHGALRAAGVDSTMHVASGGHGRPSVEGPRGPLGKAMSVLRPRLAGLALGLCRTRSESKHSPAILPSGRVRRLNRSTFGLVHLHWVADEMLSVRDIGRITKPVVWTLHDMWAFCGAEHIAWDERYRQGYLRVNRPRDESGFDVNRWTWNRKRRAWRRPIQIVAPSRWLAQCARESVLMRDWPIEVIPNAIDLEAWAPIDRCMARRLLGIREDARVVAFGSMGENRAYHKGGDLLFAALERVRGELPGLELIVFGEDRPPGGRDPGVPTHYVGTLHDELSLRIVYSAAAALVIPSRKDNLPNTGVEALASGTPIVAFDTCGLPDLVTHEETGFLARPFETDDLARGIRWVVSDEARAARLARNARAFAEERFAAPHVAARYLAVYQQTLARWQSAGSNRPRMGAP
jgi:glycosyltransferase involved in cell wall biosynthesis